MWPFVRVGSGTLRLVDGRRVTVRPVAATDRDDIQAFVRKLDPQTRRRRYFVPIRELSDPMLDSLVHPDPERERVYVAVEADGMRRPVIAVAQYAAGKHADECEVALVLADDVQGQGLGSRLLARLLAAARAGAFRRAVGDVLRDNRAMIALARHAGFDVELHPEDPELLRIARSLDEASPPPAPPRLVEVVARGVDALRTLAPSARGAGRSGLEPV